MRFTVCWLAGVCVLMLNPATARPQTRDAASWAAEIQANYRMYGNLSYLPGDHPQTKLDVYVPRTAVPGAPAPTVMFIHGGGWAGGDSKFGVLQLMPYLEMGWATVNVNYRGWLSPGGHAPVAVEDSRCALRWIIRNAQKYNLDVNRIVVTGESSGSHLALAVGMIPDSAGLDVKCPGQEPLRVAAIINWYGMSDLVDVVTGPNQRDFAQEWIQEPDREAMARRLSPIAYVSAGLPPVLTFHGDADDVAPFDQSVRLHRALDAAGIPNDLVRIPGGKHGGFSSTELIRSYAQIREFLTRTVRR